ncbi:hypothetical protein GCM10009754_32830 [Amycolatopsis minnesotensis]|uniref:Uncharacterized protein n=1 Tax=Amycolatopsis minnesotensis TaxID=337894 RepID=A0ABN2QXB6_9PSEU
MRGAVRGYRADVKVRAVPRAVHEHFLAAAKLDPEVAVRQALRPDRPVPEREKPAGALKDALAAPGSPKGPFGACAADFADRYRSIHADSAPQQGRGKGQRGVRAVAGAWCRTARVRTGRSAAHRRLVRPVR